MSFASLGRFQFSSVTPSCLTATSWTAAHQASIPRYFILFDAVVIGIVSLTSLSDISLLVYRNATDFCILILCLAILLNSLMSSSRFLVAFLGFSMYIVRSFVSSDSLTSFPVWIPFISFSSLIAVLRTSKTMLNKSGESGHPCLVLDLRGNAFSFSPLSMMLAVGLSYMGFIMLSYVLSMPTF